MQISNMPMLCAQTIVVATVHVIDCIDKLPVTLAPNIDNTLCDNLLETLLSIDSHPKDQETAAQEFGQSIFKKIFTDLGVLQRSYYATIGNAEKPLFNLSTKHDTDLVDFFEKKIQRPILRQSLMNISMLLQRINKNVDGRKCAIVIFSIKMLKLRSSIKSMQFVYHRSYHF